jgi:peptide deformylase
MAVLPIVTFNDPVLRKKTEPIAGNSDLLQELIDDMFETMYNSNGVGLAAPQIGKPLRLFVMDADAVTQELENEDDLGPVVMINPEIVELAGEKVRMEEGCLSIPDVRDDVARPERVKVRYLNRDFEPQELDAGGWIARVIQHEYDHLEGKLFIDYLSAFRKRLHRSLLKKIEHGELQVEYPVMPKQLTRQG